MPASSRNMWCWVEERWNSFLDAIKISRRIKYLCICNKM